MAKLVADRLAEEKRAGGGKDTGADEERMVLRKLVLEEVQGMLGGEVVEAALLRVGEKPLEGSKAA